MTENDVLDPKDNFMMEDDFLGKRGGTMNAKPYGGGRSDSNPSR
jgi:hypothetical protein